MLCVSVSFVDLQDEKRKDAKHKAAGTTKAPSLRLEKCAK
jgi:hypothetical protein